MDQDQVGDQENMSSVVESQPSPGGCGSQEADADRS
jgi:hypothetical protein